MNRAFELHQLRPVVDRVFEFGNARAAFEHLASGKRFGKVVIRSLKPRFSLGHSAGSASRPAPRRRSSAASVRCRTSGQPNSRFT